MAEAVNRLLVVGFYLLNLGYASLLLKAEGRSARCRCIEVLSSKLGLLLLSLGGMHFFNLYLFHRIRRRMESPSCRPCRASDDGRVEGPRPSRTTAWRAPPRRSRSEAAVRPTSGQEPGSPRTPGDPMKRLTVLYDASCPICVRCRDWLVRPGRIRQLEFCLRSDSEERSAPLQRGALARAPSWWWSATAARCGRGRPPSSWPSGPWRTTASGPTASAASFSKMAERFFVALSHRRKWLAGWLAHPAAPTTAATASAPPPTPPPTVE